MAREGDRVIHSVAPSIGCATGAGRRHLKTVEVPFASLVSVATRWPAPRLNGNIPSIAPFRSPTLPPAIAPDMHAHRFPLPILASAALAVIATAIPARAQSPTTATIVLRAARLIDGSGAAPITDAAVVVTGNKIVA